MLILWGSSIFRGGGVTKKQYIWGIAYKGGLWQFAGGLAKNREGVFEVGLIPHAHYDLILVHDGTYDWICLCEHIEFWSVVPTV